MILNSANLLVAPCTLQLEAKQAIMAQGQTKGVWARPKEFNGYESAPTIR